MATIEKYRDDYFLRIRTIPGRISQSSLKNYSNPKVYPPLPDDFPSESLNLSLLETRVREKAERYGFPQMSLGTYKKWVPEHETQGFIPYKMFVDRYRVKYKDDFFAVEEETEDKVLICAGALSIGMKYGIPFDNYRAQALGRYPIYKWVKRENIMEIVEIQDRIGFYDNHVVYILEESEDSFLITTNIPESIFLFVETRDVKKRIPRGEKVDFQTRRGYVTPPSNIPMGLKLEERENELVHDFWKTNPVRRGRRKKKGICLADLS